MEYCFWNNYSSYFNIVLLGPIIIVKEWSIAFGIITQASSIYKRIAYRPNTFN